MSGFNFKSSGKKIDNRKFTNRPKSFTELTPIGIKTPLQTKNTADLYVTHTSPELQLKDNIRNFLQTNNGERLGRYKYGANLSQFVFDISHVDNYKQNIISQVTNTITKNFTGIVLAAVEVLINEESFESLNVLDQLAFRKKNFLKEADKFSSIDSSETSLAKVKVIVNFSIPNLKITNQKVEAIIFAGG